MGGFHGGLDITHVTRGPGKRASHTLAGNQDGCSYLPPHQKAERWLAGTSSLEHRNLEPIFVDMRGENVRTGDSSLKTTAAVTLSYRGNSIESEAWTTLVTPSRCWSTLNDPQRLYRKEVLHNILHMGTFL